MIQTHGVLESRYQQPIFLNNWILLTYCLAQIAASQNHLNIDPYFLNDVNKYSSIQVLTWGIFRFRK